MYMILDFVPIINTHLHVKNCSNRTIHYNGDSYRKSSAFEISLAPPRFHI